jgi:integrase
MQSGVLTELTIRKLSAPPGERIDVWDAKLAGFGVRISGRSKTFVYMVRVGGRKRRMSLGRYPDTTLAEARAKAHAIRGGTADGGSPEDFVAAAAKSWRFSDVVEEFIEKHCGQYNRASTTQGTSRLLKTRFVTAWGARDIREVRKRDVIAVVDRDVDAGLGSTANHALAAVHKLFNWCVARGLIETNPAMGIARPAPLVTRDRVLNDKELAAVWRAAGTIGYPFGTLVKLLILTGQRRGEVAGMRWSELDLDKRQWLIPGERTKNKRAHLLPLSDAAVELLKAVPRVNDTLVFPARGREMEVMSGFSKMKPKLEAICPISDWGMHDLRRSAATGMARLGVPPHVVERVLNHSSGTFAGVAGVYNRFEYAPEMRDALELWASHIANINERT